MDSSNWFFCTSARDCEAMVDGRPFNCIVDPELPPGLKRCEPR
jgi:hypothetical protein